MRFIGHEREESVPGEVGHVDVEELQADRDESEVDELQRRPHNAVHHVGIHIHFPHLAPRLLPYIWCNSYLSYTIININIEVLLTSRKEPYTWWW